MNAEVRSPVLQVGWKVHALSAGVASVRYRAVMPMLALQSDDVQCRLFASGADANLEGLDVLVIVKSFTPDDLRLAQVAAERGIRVVFDLCDNIFIGDYGRKGMRLTPAQMLQSMAPFLSCIVTTTEPLAEAIRAHLPQARVVVIPDGIETHPLVKQVGLALAEAKVRERSQRVRALRQRIRNVMRRVQVEGVRVIPSLGVYAARRGARAVAHRVHALLSRQRVAAEPVSGGIGLPDSATKRILWFGNHGAEHARFGMLDILEYRSTLEALAAEQDVELVVVSNNREKYEKSIRPLAIRSRYVEWTQRAVPEWLQRAAVVIIPNTLDEFSLCKSANRTVLALSHGVPVVATMTPALQPLAGFIHAGDPLQALRSVLANPEAERQRATDGYRRAQELFGPDAVRRHWMQVLQGLPPSHGRSTEGKPAPSLAVVLHLIQDLDLALPILEEADTAGIAVEAWCSGELVLKSPRVLATLREQGIPCRVLPAADELRRFRFDPATRVLLTVAETNLGPHRVPRLLTEIANRSDVFTATLQHGFENVALTYEDALHHCGNVNIAAQRIYIWGPAETLHPNITAATRARCVAVGCPKPAVVPAAPVADLLPQGRPVIGIFENLHWHRYPESYKHDFVATVTALARSRPDLFFLLKPHHAGLWLTRKYEGEPPLADNLLIADPQLPPWEQYTASGLLGHMHAVITSPSTVALDAARRGIPAAVVAGDLSLENYKPLPLLRTVVQWQEFVDALSGQQTGQELRERSAAFAARVLVPGNAARKIVDDLRMVVGSAQDTR